MYLKLLHFYTLMTNLLLWRNIEILYYTSMVHLFVVICTVQPNGLFHVFYTFPSSASLPLNIPSFLHPLFSYFALCLQDLSEGDFPIPSYTLWSPEPSLSLKPTICTLVEEVLVNHFWEKRLEFVTIKNKRMHYRRQYNICQFTIFGLFSCGLLIFVLRTVTSP